VPSRSGLDTGSRPVVSTRSNTLIKIGLALGVVAALGVLFVRSILQERSKPYTVGREHLRQWTLALERASSPNAPMLLLRPVPELVPELFHDIFARAMESLSAPTAPALALVLQGEFDRAFAGHVTPEALLEAARAAGLGSSPLEPRCLVHRYVSDPGAERQAYFVLFDAPSFRQFRDHIGALRQDGGAARAGYDPWALSPVLFIATSDGAPARWLPVRADPDTDCTAPIIVG
jgi:hypothetical protein